MAMDLHSCRRGENPGTAIKCESQTLGFHTYAGVQPAHLVESVHTASLSSLALWVLRPSSHLQRHPEGFHHWTPPGPPPGSRVCSLISGHGWLGVAKWSGETPSSLGLLILLVQMELEEQEKKCSVTYLHYQLHIEGGKTHYPRHTGAAQQKVRGRRSALIKTNS